MMVFGAGASTYGAKCERFAFSRFSEVTLTTVPAGTLTGAAAAGRIPVAVRSSSLSPIRIRCWGACQSVGRSSCHLCATSEKCQGALPFGRGAPHFGMLPRRHEGSRRANAAGDEGRVMPRCGQIGAC